MRQSIGPILFVLMLVFLLLPVSGLQEIGNDDQAVNEESEIIKFYPLLKGVNYVRLRCKFNGMPYFKGYKTHLDTKMEEYFLDETADSLKKADIPISKKDIRSLYDSLEARVKDADVRILDINPGGKKKATLIPSLTLNIDVKTVSEGKFFILEYLTLTRWMSSWFGNESLEAPVIIWWHKKMLSADKKSFSNSIESTAKELTSRFLAHLAYANKD
jgi:hypothetical protein